MPHAITFGQYSFPSKAALERAAQAEITPHPLEEIFVSDFLSDMIAARHPFCSRNNLRPICFKKLYAQKYRAGYHFNGNFPNNHGWHNGWHPVSWRKCLTQPTYDDEVKAFLRWTIQADMASCRGPDCEMCGIDDLGTKMEVDHKEPTFDQIYKRVATLFRPEERSIWAYYNWDAEPGFQLPDDHPAFVAFKTLHESATLQTLCQSCHRKVTKERRGEQ